MIEKNKINADIEFYFKGKKIAASLALDLDDIFSKQAYLPDLYSQLAQSIGLSLYSYEYEIMQSESITFSQAIGLAKNYLTDGIFDQQGFQAERLKQKALLELSLIAKEHLQVEKLSKQPNLEAALFEAFLLGKNF